MARTKRNVNPLVPAAEPLAHEQRIYKAGGYVRLSVEDSGKKDADTIEAQKELIERYIAAQPVNDEGVPTPAQYRREIGQLKTDRYDNARWNIFTLKSIVGNPVYLSHTVQGRKRSGLCQGQKQRRTKKAQWITVENTHKPLIDEDTFRAVQAMSEQASQAHCANLGNYDRLMDEREYMELKQQYRTEIEQARADIVELERRRSQQEQQNVNNHWLKNFGRFAAENKPTKFII